MWGETDEFSYNILRDAVHVRDLQVTPINQFGIDRKQFTFKYQGIAQRLTGAEKASVVQSILMSRRYSERNSSSQVTSRFVSKAMRPSREVSVLSAASWAML